MVIELLKYAAIGVLLQWLFYGVVAVVFSRGEK